MKSNHITCHKCHDTGILTKKCRKCGGTKIFEDNVCPLCKGSGHYRFIKTSFRENEIKCPYCKQPKRKKKSKNPVISPKLGAKLKKKFKRKNIITLQH